MKLKVVYIAGLYHTGSTLLDMLLGSLPDVIGLGEIFKCFHDKFEKNCSCGKTVEECEFWGSFAKNNSQKLNIQNEYEKVIEKFEDLYGKNSILVDSSKCHPFKFFASANDRKMQGLDHLINIDDIDLKVIHIVRDVRSWSNSLLMRDAKEKNKNTIFANSFRLLFRSSFARFVQWYWGHKKIINFINKNNLNHIKISYEDLAINPKKTLLDITRFLGLEYSDSMLKPSNTSSHIAVGNPMRFRESDIENIRYDYRWMSSNKLSFPSFILYPVMRLNRKLIYSKNLEK